MLAEGAFRVIARLGTGEGVEVSIPFNVFAQNAAWAKHAKMDMAHWFLSALSVKR